MPKISGELERLTNALKTIQTDMVLQSDERVHKIDDLMERLSHSATVRVAFCGLFSAGKSSLINALAETSALATGAVPTTARVQSVELPDTDKSVVLVDTPGIDSTDSTHQKATLETLHQADVVLLVMDYQHVESMQNLEFARTLTEEGRSLWLVIHQIDKHFDFELPFTDYCERVESTFREWDIHFEAIFYTSSEANALYNQLKDLKVALHQLKSEAQIRQFEGVVRAARALVREYVDGSSEFSENRISKRLEDAFGRPIEDVDDARRLLSHEYARARELEEETEQKRLRLHEAQSAWRERLARSIELAQISPYETTEKGRLFVESLRPNFRVGWLHNAAKVERVREERLAVFCEDLTSYTANFLVTPLQNELRGLIRETSWARSNWLADVERVTCIVEPNLLQSSVKTGALVSEQYPYQYVKDVTQAIKRRVFTAVTLVLDEWFRQTDEELSETTREQDKTRHYILERASVLESYIRFMDDKRLHLERLLGFLPELEGQVE